MCYKTRTSSRATDRAGGVARRSGACRSGAPAGAVDRSGASGHSVLDDPLLIEKPARRTRPPTFSSNRGRPCLRHTSSPWPAGSNPNCDPKAGERMPKLWNKPIAALQAEAADIVSQEQMTPCRVLLKRTLSAMSLIALGIGKHHRGRHFLCQYRCAHAGPAIGLSFVISATACAFRRHVLCGIGRAP